MTKTAQDFVNHWIWAGNQGLMAKRTAQAYASSCRQILSVQDAWETVDFENLAQQVDDLLFRFKNLRRLSPRTLQSYEVRFRRAVESYQTYLSDPARWRYLSRGQSQNAQSPRRDRTPRTRAFQQAPSPPKAAESTNDELLEYIFPFRKSTNARVAIPRDATTAEINRLVDFLRPLAIDYESSSS